MSSFTVCAISFEALLLYAVVVDDNLRRSPRLHLNNLAGNTPAVNASGRGRVKHLRTASKLLADVFGCLSRQDVDSYQLVCRGWRETIEEHAEHLSLRRLSVWLFPRPLLIYYRARCRRGIVQGALFNGLRECDKAYFKNTVVDVRTHEIVGLDRSSTKVIRMIFNKAALKECNIRISALHVEVRASELPEIFQVAKDCSARCLKLFYRSDRYISDSKTCTEEGLSRFIAAVFRESGVHHEPLNVSIEHVRFGTCSMATKAGHLLLSKLTRYDLHPGPEHLAVCMPNMGGLQFIRLFVENFNEDAVLPARLTFVFPSTVTLAQLWSDNLEHFDDARGRWVVPVGGRRLVMHAKSVRPGTTSYMFSTE
ncbi:hypothetical protein AAVH_25961 [Aphelenchoides avenae]|nr:hypothetical protein AAVH_25961 [Aphelenchus avenae]